ncbi:hypothetical protein [Jeotgalicoccus sp. WY2]|uniref:hypothetical protein n=1 Tax=Jeotgalicoccus sp. WY2 TaxID=2708346 RepID=UPI001BD30FA0|nr:hypothetical protein [Jeotgalicoccus sp. WY2]
MWPAINHSLEKGDYQEAIKDIKKFGLINDQQIQERIADNYSLDKIDIRKVEDNNYQDLLKDNFKVYVTTNYDKLMEK